MGILGTEDVTVGGITVKGQIFDVAERLTDAGSGIDSGILRLAYPAITNAHEGTTVDNATIRTNHTTYLPTFFNMFMQGSVAPWYSLALDRLGPSEQVAPGGYLGLGELPPVEAVEFKSAFVSVPAEINKAVPLSFANGKPKRSEWTLTIDSIVWGHRHSSVRSTNTTRFQGIIDSGGVYNVPPEEVVNEIFALYTKPPVLDPATGAYAVDCDTTPALLGVTIGGETFFLTAQDMIIHNLDGSCQSSLLPAGLVGGEVYHALAGRFLTNVVSVFDFGKNEMRFSARADGGGSSKASRG